MSIKGTDNTSAASSRRLRLGMVGGGRGAFIGSVHRMAARLDDRYELVAGALSSSAEIALSSASDLGISPDRAYADFRTMATEEARRSDGIDVVSIVTPNKLHFEACKVFLEAGIHVICDKPMTSSLEEALALHRLAQDRNLVLVLTQNNTGYPMVRQARAMVRDGRIGKVRHIQVNYIQDWLTTPIEQSGHKQASWRMDPAAAGKGGVIADLGVHAFNLASFITNLELEQVCADLRTFVEGRALDDNANVLLRYTGGATGTMWVSQVAPGHNNSLSIGIYGDAGSIQWNGEQNDYLLYTSYGCPPQIITRGGPGAEAVAARATRMPAGHPEGYIEGFANLYSNAADLIQAHAGERDLDASSAELPGTKEGVDGLRFIDACIESSRDGASWKSMLI
ncbi:Gfo/Idh/MocA family oxidoreductase [Caballeronia novacaledonica]|uniref:Gfo/Idh/MocA family protein n=1 Tax=Caballeronia novacaledonica TaxID=1544861 RepID=UPI00041B0544|nr:Gfo/Idh/MocA family oxidoreductase [Caballeronia novacaledonica]GJH14539.1 Gfo/Idh/MocA family oxidoreductase [Caballeronia novacaledonica]